MPFHVVCPGCQASYDLPDALRGQPFHCKDCQKTFLAAPPSARKGTEAEEIQDVLPVAEAKGESIPDVLPAEVRSPARQDLRHRTERTRRRPPIRVAEDDSARPRPGPSIDKVLALATVGLALFLILALGGAVLWAYRMRQTAPAPGSAAVVHTQRTPTQPGPPPAPPPTRRVPPDPGPVPPSLPTGRLQIPAPNAPVKDLPIPPDPPPAQPVDWSDLEIVVLPEQGEAQGVAPDPAPTLKETPQPGPFALEAHGNEVHHLLFPSEGAQALVVSSRPAGQQKRVVRVERIDLASGRPLGTVDLYGRMIENPIAMFAPRSAVSPDGNLFALIDIDGRQRVDVWSLKDGKHVAGFLALEGATGGTENRERLPRGRAAGREGQLVRDLAFVDAEHLLVLSTPSYDSSHGRVVLWKLPEAKPLYQFTGTGMPWLSLSLGGKYLAADTPTGYVLLEPLTGKVVGQLPFPKERVLATGMTGFSRDGTRFAAEITLFGQGTLPDHQLVAWDLQTGAITHSFHIKMPLLVHGLQWFGDSMIFMGWDLWSLDFHRILVRYSVGGALATTSPDGRLWYTAAPADNQPASLYGRTLPDDVTRKVLRAFKEKKSIPSAAKLVPLEGEPTQRHGPGL